MSNKAFLALACYILIYIKLEKVIFYNWIYFIYKAHIISLHILSTKMILFYYMIVFRAITTLVDQKIKVKIF